MDMIASEMDKRSAIIGRVTTTKMTRTKILKVEPTRRRVMMLTLH